MSWIVRLLRGLASWDVSPSTLRLLGTVFIGLCTLGAGLVAGAFVANPDWPVVPPQPVVTVTVPPQPVVTVTVTVTPSPAVTRYLPVATSGGGGSDAWVAVAALGGLALGLGTMGIGIAAFLALRRPKGDPAAVPKVQAPE
jgi:hypothetical protein